MLIKDYDTIFSMIQDCGKTLKIMIPAAASREVVDGGLECAKAGFGIPVFVGDETLIRNLIEGSQIQDADYEILKAADETEACKKAIEQIRAGNGDCLMKGNMETSDFLRPVLSKEHGLRTDRMLTQIGFAKLPGYHKLIALSDGAILPYPDKEQKWKMIENMAAVFHALGVEKPNIALLSAVEVENPAIPGTKEAAALKERWKNMENPGFSLEGPISYDLALSAESARRKHYDCPWCGDFDGLIAPDIVVANVLGKAWQITSHTPQGGLVYGAKVPILVNSRSMGADDRLRSVAVALAVSMGMQKS